MGQPFPIWIARHGEIGNISLQNFGQRRNQRWNSRHIARPTIVERVRHIVAVKRGRYLKLVSVGFVPERAGQLVRVACEDALGNEEDRSLETVSVWQRPVINSRVKRLSDIGYDLWSHAGICRGEEFFQLRVSPHARIREENAFIGVVAGHDFDIFSKGAGSE